MAMRAIPIFDVEAAVANIAVHRGAAETIDEGIFVEDATWSRLQALAQEFGVAEELSLEG